MKLFTRAFLAAIALVIFPKLVLAAGYIPLERIPGTSQTANLPEYVSAIYRFGIWTIGIAAFLMITIGGFMYMTSAGNNSRMNSAKDVITDSLWGIAVAMLAWLLLFIINPDFVAGNLSLGKGDISAPAGIAAAPVAPVPYVSASTKEMAQRLSNESRITFSPQGSCRDVNGSQVTPRSNIQEAANGHMITSCADNCGRCGAKVGLSDKLLSSLLCVANKGISFTVTSFAGGAHTEGSMHYAGSAADISIADKNKFIDAMKGCGAYARCDKKINGRYVYVDCSQNPDSLHVSLNGR